MDIVIIGAGASSSICAIEASKNKSNNLIIIESNNKPLKKLLITGNGKCNYTNLNFKDKKIITKENINEFYNNDFYYNSFKNFNNTDLIDYFYKLGMPISIFDKYDKKYIYPITKNSRTLYYLLLDNLNKNNIKINTNETVISFDKKNDKFIINTDKNKYTAKVLVISAGGKSYCEKDNTKYLYDNLNKLNIKTNKTFPALAPLYIDKNIFGKNSKFRFEAYVSLVIDDEIVSSEFGEIQINNDSISGIPILNLSSRAISAISNNKKVVLCINFLYNFFYNKYIADKVDIDFNKYMQDEMIKYFNKQLTSNNKLSIKQLLAYILEPQLVEITINKLKIEDKNVENLTKVDIDRLIDCLLNFKINIISYADYKLAQLTQGGVDIDEIDDMTFESKKIKNLYFTGEIIDVNGICGGYNLQFAFGSGFTVGKILNDKN